MNTSQSEINIFPNNAQLIQATADHFVHHAAQVIKATGRCTVVLAGGSTPKSLYELLATARYQRSLDWERIEFFWGDERHVPPDHQESNYRMAYEALLGHLALSPSSIHRIPSERPCAQSAADQYESILRTRFQETNSHGFDFVLLGMGEDGHTASLFPGTAVVHESTRWVAAPWIEHMQTSRITLTPPILNQARQVTLLISGDAKAKVLQEVLEGPYQPDRFPVQVIRPTAGHTTWFLDQSATGMLSANMRSLCNQMP